MTIFDAAKILKVLLGSNIIAGHEVTDAGALAITWVQGQIFNISGDLIVDVVSGGDNVTDDDTSYLVWNSGTALELQAGTATGNQVLVAQIDASGVDIDTITEAGFDFSSVSGLGGRLVIRLLGDKEPPFYNEYGEFIIEEENLVVVRPSFSFRKEEYRIICNLMIDSHGPALLKAIISQIDSVFRTNNKSQTKDYHFDLKGGWPTNYKAGLIKLVIDAKKSMRAL